MWQFDDPGRRPDDNADASAMKEVG